jgi:hypothetical protein
MNMNAPGSPSGPTNPAAANFDIRRISASELAVLGLSQVAYIKPVMVEGGGIAYAIHGADGTAMALAENLEIAATAIRQHEMIPTLVQ